MSTTAEQTAKALRQLQSGVRRQSDGRGSYRIDWIQLLAALTALVAYGVVIWSCFALYIAWPVSTPGMIVAFLASGVWSHRRDVHERGRK